MAKTQRCSLDFGVIMSVVQDCLGDISSFADFWVSVTSKDEHINAKMLRVFPSPISYIVYLAAFVNLCGTNRLLTSAKMPPGTGSG